MMYRDRADAGRHLARLLSEQLPALRGESPVVIATLPGGVPVGRAIADGLGASLDVIVARRLNAPGGYADVGIGAVVPGGTRILDGQTIRMLGVSEAYIDEVSRVEVEAAERELAAVRVAGEPLNVEGRAVILTDDGSTTRWGAAAAIASLRAMGARRLILAVPVCSSDVRDLLARRADAVVCGTVPERDCGAAALYADFTPPTNETLRRLLSRPSGLRVAEGKTWRQGARGDAPAGA